MANIQDSLSEILKELKNTGDIEASVISSNQGLVMVSDVPENVPGARLGAYTATIMGSAKTVMEEIQKNPPNMLIIRSPDAITIIMEAGKLAILSSLFRDEMNIGLVIVEMEKACRKISKILE
ncbi:MAG: roadblock/LC7 domain-containing protein [Methanosarcinales archaeon]|nr:roadblock/LC7 domain-containing protein [Methanosarcinales archaeon]